VSFQFNETTALMNDYIVLIPSRSTSVFQTITPSVVAVGASSVNGSIFSHVGSAMGITVHNNPTSALIISSRSVTLDVTFSLSPGIDADRNGQSLNISAPDLAARLFVTGAATLTLSGADATATLPQGTSAIFRADATSGEGAAGALGQRTLGNASVAGLLALEIFSVSLEGFIALSDVEYGGYNTLGASVVANGLEVNLVGTSASPKLAALHLHDSVIPADNETEISVTLDGQPVSKLSTLDDVLTHGGSESVYADVLGENGLLLLIKLAGQGDHVLKVEKVTTTESQGLNPIQLAAIVAVVLALLGVAAAVMLRRRPPQ